MVFLYGHTGCLAAQNDGFRPGKRLARFETGYENAGGVLVRPQAVFTLIEPPARATPSDEEEDAEGDAAAAGRDNASDAAEEDVDLVEPAAGGGVIFMPPCLCCMNNHE